MGNRKFKGTQLFDGYRMRGAEVVLITDETGVIADLIDVVNAGEGIEQVNGVLCPGFINCHCHLELSHLRGIIPEKTGLVDFILTVVNERHFDDAIILAAIENAEDEMLRNGIVAVGDICNNTLTIPQKEKGRLPYHNFVEVSGFPPGVAEMRFERARTILETFRTSCKLQAEREKGEAASYKLQGTSLTPHAPYSVSKELFRMIDAFPDNSLLTIHNQETNAENELFSAGTGDFIRLYKKMGIDISFFKPPCKSSLQTFLPYFTKAQTLILVHNVATSADDIKFQKLQTTNHKPQTYFCLCPNANLYITNTLPDLGLFLDQAQQIVLGTDSLASNHQLSIWEEIRTLQDRFPQIDLSTMLTWATINGARALQMDDTLGSFEKGKKPGVVLIEGLDNTHITPDSSIRRIL